MFDVSEANEAELCPRAVHAVLMRASRRVDVEQRAAPWSFRFANV